LIITIDDIDRLSNKEIIAVFQLVKSLADFPYTTYLLAFDYKIVTRALGKVQKCDGAKYLEKIVQVPFSIPLANSEDIYNMFKSEISRLMGDIEKESDRHYRYDTFWRGVKYYINTIRDSSRLINLLTLKYSIIKEEVNPIDLVGITCLEVFEPDIYLKLHLYEKVICGYKEIADDTTGKRKKEIERFWNDIFNDIPAESEGKKEAVKNILHFLFPQLGNVINASVSYDDIRIAKRISHTDSFKRYFSLALEKEAIPTKHLEWLVFNADNDSFIAEVDKINKDDKINALLKYIIEVSGKKEKSLPSKRLKLIFNCICKTLQNVDDNNYSAYVLFKKCSYLLLKNMNVDDCCSSLKNVINDPIVELSTISVLFKDLELNHNRFFEVRYDDNEQFLKLENILEIEKLFLKRTSVEIKERILDDDSFVLFINVIEKTENNDDKSSIISCIEKTDYGMINLISYATVYVISSNSANIDYNYIKTFTENTEFLTFDIETKKKIVAYLMLTERSDNEDTSSIERNLISEKEVIERLNAIENLGYIT